MVSGVSGTRPQALGTYRRSKAVRIVIVAVLRGSETPRRNYWKAFAI